MIKQSILVIDDDGVDRKAACRALARAGWDGEVQQAADAAEARQQLIAHQFDCILLDYRLPGTDGLELLTELRTMLAIQAPIIMLTGEGDEMVAVEAMKRGAFDYLPKALLTPESLRRVLSQAMERKRLQDELARVQAQLERQALYDSLTHLGNRILFRRDLARMIAGAQRRSSSFYVLMMDLDHFKAANDSYGHDAGDAVLAEVGRRLVAAGRASDAFFRLGGDEFTAIIDAAAPDAIEPVLQRIASSVALPIPFRSHMLAVGVSIGIARYPDDGATVDDLLRAADAAMYRVKRAGKGLPPSGHAG